ncbi:hypothetical protein FOY91_07655 [Sphingomonas solaris]|uniref:UrcA family protein n=1 Tax=Alterirhizorhabdus solaris TaxID=2529389 RepID=A0A558R735_9SPHN|nr:hypothetical protein FOY91_07655 [Sphingomonas solaris]
MPWRRRVALGAVAALVVALAPAAAEARDGDTSRPRNPTPPVAVNVPGLAYPVYVLPVGPKDDRTPRQRCWDAETARLGTPLTELDRRTIDLKCSQR